jgi:hypothetical protein
MAARDKLEKKLRRYRTALAHYKGLIKEAEQEMKDRIISKEKYRKRKHKYESKKNRVLKKMKNIRLKMQE